MSLLTLITFAGALVVWRATVRRGRGAGVCAPRALPSPPPIPATFERTARDVKKGDLILVGSDVCTVYRIMYMGAGVHRFYWQGIAGERVGERDWCEALGADRVTMVRPRASRLYSTI